MTGGQRTIMASTTKKSTSRTSTTAPRPSDAIAELKSDHRDVEALFARFDGVGATAHKTRNATVAKIIVALSVHAAIEETVFYPALRSRLDADDPILEALEEHHLVKLTLSELEKMSSQDERYTAKVTVLKESVQHHVKEEEGDLFSKCRKLFTRGELVELGDRLRDAKRGAPTRPHPSSPDTPPGNVVATALTAPLDAAANLAGKAVGAVRDLVT